MSPLPSPYLLCTIWIPAKPVCAMPPARSLLWIPYAQPPERLDRRARERRRSYASCPSRTIPRRSAVRVPGQVLAASKLRRFYQRRSQAALVSRTIIREWDVITGSARATRSWRWRARWRTCVSYRRCRHPPRNVIGNERPDECGRTLAGVEGPRPSHLGQLFARATLQWGDSVGKGSRASKPGGPHIPDNYSRVGCRYGVGARASKLRVLPIPDNSEAL